MEELKNENLEVKENEEVSLVQSFRELGKRTNTKSQIFTNVTDKKKLFNTESHVDNLLNECEGELIRVKEVIIKRYEKPLKTPEIDEETGEIIKDKEITMACILIDDNNKTYATGSKIFTVQMMKYIEMFGIDEKGFEIKITKTKQEKGKSLGFEVV